LKARKIVTTCGHNPDCQGRQPPENRKKKRFCPISYFLQ